MLEANVYHPPTTFVKNSSYAEGASSIFAFKSCELTLNTLGTIATSCLWDLFQHTQPTDSKDPSSNYIFWFSGTPSTFLRPQYAIPIPTRLGIPKIPQKMSIFKMFQNSIVLKYDVRDILKTLLTETISRLSPYYAGNSADSLKMSARVSFAAVHWRLPKEQGSKFNMLCIEPVQPCARFHLRGGG
jgi:hypothetical protein